MRFFLGLIAMMSVAIAGAPSMAAKKDKTPPTPSAPQRLAPPPITDKENLLYLDLSTGGRVVIDFAIPDWSKLHARSGRLERFVVPRMLEAATD